MWPQKSWAFVGGGGHAGVLAGWQLQVCRHQVVGFQTLGSSAQAPYLLSASGQTGLHPTYPAGPCLLVLTPRARSAHPLCSFMLSLLPDNTPWSSAVLAPKVGTCVPRGLSQ